MRAFPVLPPVRSTAALLGDPGYLPTDTSVNKNWNDSAFTWAGVWFNSGGLRYVWSGTIPARVDFSVTGTRCDVTLYSPSVANNWEYSIDGGAWTTATVPTTGSTVVTLFSGPHKKRTVALRSKSGNGGQLNMTSTITIYGHTTPTVSKSPSFNDAPIIINTSMGADSTAFLKLDGSQKTINFGSNYNPQYATFSCTGGTVRFKATCSSIYLWAQTFSSEILRLAVDDVLTSHVITSSDSTWGYKLIASDLDGTAEHEYRIIGASASERFYPYQVAVDGTINTGGPASKTKVAFYGDSIFRGTGVSDSALGCGIQSMLALGWVGRMAALDFRAVRNFGSSPPGGSLSGESGVAADLSAYATDFAKIIVLLGANDAIQTFGTYNAASYNASYDAMLASLRSAYPSAEIHCLGMLNTSNANGSTNRASVLAQTQQAVTDAADANIFYHSTEGWITPATDTTDGLHPNTAGVAKIVTQMEALF